MSLTTGQPRVRFAGHFNPGDIAGLSYEPKVISVKKTLAATATNNIVALPAGAFLSRIVAVCSETSASTDAALTVGTDGDTDLFINATDFTGFTMETVGNAAVFSAGHYFAAADNLALQVTGTTVTNGEVQMVIEYYELAEMFQTGGVHVSL